jgi:hypothetical protein
MIQENSLNRVASIRRFESGSASTTAANWSSSALQTRPSGFTRFTSAVTRSSTALRVVNDRRIDPTWVSTQGVSLISEALPDADNIDAFVSDVVRSSFFHHKKSDGIKTDLDIGPNNYGVVTVRRCVDIDTRAWSVMRNVVMPIRSRDNANWRPYGTAGLGLIHASFSDGDQVDTARLTFVLECLSRAEALIAKGGRSTWWIRLSRQGVHRR